MSTQRELFENCEVARKSGTCRCSLLESREITEKIRTFKILILAGSNPTIFLQRGGGLPP